MFCCFIVVCCIRYMKHLGCFGFCGAGIDCGADLVLVLVVSVGGCCAWYVGFGLVVLWCVWVVGGML